ncbi:MAG: hypothetical protein PHD61_08460 [Bacteroidales bacterium]|nr:hypothetical protein [Lentimicrobiaceae bacterium]MDD5695323.1 hypothetical protein [Bacteroidales bacterium]
MKKYTIAFGIILVFTSLFALSCGNHLQQGRKKAGPAETLVLQTNLGGKGIALEVQMLAGEHHNHPMMAIWVEDTAGHYIQTLFVNRSVATSTYGHGDKSGGVWQPGMVRRPAAVPYWSHQRGIEASDSLFMPDPLNPVPDAYTGPTPPGDFILKTRTDQVITGKVNILFEINQSWDWNQYWNNALYPNDDEYHSSAQPAVVYRATIDLSDTGREYVLAPIGHSHYNGADGTLNPDLSTLTTALDIAREIKVKIVP